VAMVALLSLFLCLLISPLKPTCRREAEKATFITKFSFTVEQWKLNTLGGCLRKRQSTRTR
jgi:hypothetical protein